uniref:Uncharacterized protein n=1 Tax=Octopus bimaculoides TaxID=37653 RepID=A0A0L8H4C2_OCTBM
MAMLSTMILILNILYTLVAKLTNDSQLTESTSQFYFVLEPQNKWIASSTSRSLPMQQTNNPFAFIRNPAEKRYSHLRKSASLFYFVVEPPNEWKASTTTVKIPTAKKNICERLSRVKVEGEYCWSLLEVITESMKLSSRFISLALYYTINTLLEYSGSDSHGKRTLSDDNEDDDDDSDDGDDDDDSNDDDDDNYDDDDDR